MSRNKHHHNFNDKLPYSQKKSRRFDIPVSVQIEQVPTITIPVDEYESLVRITERAEAAARYIISSQYGPDKNILLTILDAVDTDEGGDDA